MASTNSYNFAVTRDNLITDALLHVGLLGEGETATANSVTEASRILNMIVKLRAADGMPLWALKRGVILPVTDVSSITTISHIVQVGSYQTTTFGADEAADQTTLTVTSSTGMTAADQIGLELDDGSMQWTTISSVTDSTTIVVATGLTSAAASGNRIYSYTASADRIGRPLRVLEANVLNTADAIGWEIDVEDRRDYYRLSDRTEEGVPNLIYYDPGLGTAVADPTSATTWYGTFFIWPRFEDGDHVIEFTYHRPFQDFDASTDHPDFPQEFYLPLMLELAALLGPKGGVPPDERRALFAEAKMYREEALSTVAAEGSYEIVPSQR